MDRYLISHKLQISINATTPETYYSLTPQLEPTFRTRNRNLCCILRAYVLWMLPFPMPLPILLPMLLSLSLPTFVVLRVLVDVLANISLLPTLLLSPPSCQYYCLLLALALALVLHLFSPLPSPSCARPHHCCRCCSMLSSEISLSMQFQNCLYSRYHHRPNRRNFLHPCPRRCACRSR